MSDTLDTVEEIFMPVDAYVELVSHGRRKAAGQFGADETREPKAYGLLGGTVEDGRLYIRSVVPLRRNARMRPGHREAMDAQMRTHAFPSETPFERRGWVASPREVLEADRRFSAAGTELVATYHMHRVPWPHDPTRDRCSTIDRVLAEGSGLWVLILSLVDPRRPTLRAFFEGNNEREAAIVINRRANTHSHEGSG